MCLPHHDMRDAKAKRWRVGEKRNIARMQGFLLYLVVIRKCMSVNWLVNQFLGELPLLPVRLDYEKN